MFSSVRLQHFEVDQFDLGQSHEQPLEGRQSIRKGLLHHPESLPIGRQVDIPRMHALARQIIARRKDVPTSDKPSGLTS